MYECHKHGKVNIGYCELCGKTLICDCSNLEDIEVEYSYITDDSDQVTVILYLEICKDCGEIQSCTW